MTDTPSPLTGMTVVEAIAPKAPDALAYAAGLCGRIAADLGARVIRTERLCEAGPATEHFLHSGKERLPAATEKTGAIAGEWAHAADVIILDPATYRELGTDLHPAIPVVIAMSRDAPDQGSEFTIEARSGLLDLVGDPAREPLRLGGHQVGYSAGLAAYLGMVAALAKRDAGLRASPVRVDLLDVAIWLNWKTLSTSARTGRAPSRPGPAAEWSVVACADGHVALVYRFQEWDALKAATGDARLADERFQTPDGRRQYRAALNAILSDIFSGKTRAEIRAMSLSYKLPLGPVWTPGELLDDPHMTARGFFHSVEVGGDRLDIPTVPLKWNGHTFAPSGRSPARRHPEESVE